MKTCFACHEKAKVSDLVFTYYAPEAQAAVLSLVFSSDTSESLGSTTQEAAAM